jgi:hypothetical protein
MNVKSILSEQFKDIISEETLNTIEEVFQEAVEAKANQRVELATEDLKTKLDEHYTTKLQTLVEKIDEDHTAKAKKLIEAIDTDHAVKLQKLVSSIDKKHTTMLKQVVEKYENNLQEEAKNFQTRLVEEISNYLDLYLDKVVPTQQISEAVENIKAAKQLNQIRQIVGITEEFVDNEIKEALVDGKKTIDSLRAELGSVIKENAELSQKVNKAEAFILLEQKTTEMPSAKKAYINKLLKNKTPQYIEENFSYVEEMFDKEAEATVDQAKEEVKNEILTSVKADRPQIIEEEAQFTNNEIEREPLSEGISGYLNEMKKISGSRFTR